MAIGMTYEQYWYGDPLMVRDFYKAWKIRQQQINEQAWLNGVYFMKALEATVGNAMRKQGSQAIEYPSKPLELYKQEETEEQKFLREEDEATFARAYMENMVLAGKNWKK